MYPNSEDYTWRGSGSDGVIYILFENDEWKYTNGIIYIYIKYIYIIYIIYIGICYMSLNTTSVIPTTTITNETTDTNYN